ncbi:MAG: helix-turn-helix domain-containing protein [Proteobacteria bacterium]|nr:helix-turn-helix domain-containing protein [Pseudomonadota bacterium]
MRPEADAMVRRVGARVRARRAELGLTAKALAESSGLSLRFISQLEAGQANIAIGRLASVAKSLGVSVAALVEAGEDQRCAIALVGLRGAGKTTLGNALSTHLALPFVEVDEQIETAAGLGLGQIFQLHGEDYYRQLEGRCLDMLLDARPKVLALSGGVVGNARVWGVVRNRCTTVWLRATPEDHMSRVVEQGDHRPMADRADAMEELRAILADREPRYARSEVSIDTSAQSLESTLERLVSELKEHGWRAA